ncbi:MHYT domain-containing protein [Streptomyces otsuchiensis]|uniref:MHYT domain-containing protein n=1 Tax=Streptomyces otsuchiensis TaxID=2681388 RepID=UPI001031697C|nr:MHYT domain-containing protein [Streptomyces otsuchiensis]
MYAAEVPVEDLTYGLVTLVLAFLMAVVGSALGLRCTVRALTLDRGRRAGWLALGAISIGTGIFTMHFIAMMGFTVATLSITYDLAITYASLGVAIGVVGIGVFLVGYAPRGNLTLATGGLITGLGVACMHYLGMAGMQMSGTLHYDPVVVALSVVIAVVAATVALWFAISVRGFAASLGASAIMGVAVTGMHYTGMAAVSVHSHSEVVTGGHARIEILMPALVVPLLLLVFAGLFVGLDPMTTQDIHQRINPADRAPGGGPGPSDRSGTTPRAAAGPGAVR